MEKETLTSHSMYTFRLDTSNKEFKMDASNEPLCVNDFVSAAYHRAYKTFMDSFSQHNEDGKSSVNLFSRRIVTDLQKMKRVVDTIVVQFVNSFYPTLEHSKIKKLNKANSFCRPHEHLQSKQIFIGHHVMHDRVLLVDSKKIVTIICNQGTWKQHDLRVTEWVKQSIQNYYNKRPMLPPFETSFNINIRETWKNAKKMFQKMDIHTLNSKRALLIQDRVEKMKFIDLSQPIHTTVSISGYGPIHKQEMVVSPSYLADIKALSWSFAFKKAAEPVFLKSATLWKGLGLCDAFYQTKHERMVSVGGVYKGTIGCGRAVNKIISDSNEAERKEAISSLPQQDATSSAIHRCNKLKKEAVLAALSPKNQLQFDTPSAENYAGFKETNHLSYHPSDAFMTYLSKNHQDLLRLEESNNW